MPVDNRDIHKLLKYFIDLQPLDPLDCRNNQDNMLCPTRPPLKSQAHRSPRPQHNDPAPLHGISNLPFNIRPSLNHPNLCASKWSSN